MRNKVVLITGGAQRIGAQLCRTFHEAGFNVLLHYRRSLGEAENLASELNGYRRDSARIVQGDLQEGAYQNLTDACLDAWGRVDCLVNNASDFYPNDIPGTTEESWDRLMGINLKAPFSSARLFTPHCARPPGVSST